LKKYSLITIFTSTYPIDCYILKGRLETEGVSCYIYDENIISVDPFRSVAVGGVKLKVQDADVEKAKSIISLMENNQIEKVIIENESVRQNIILELKKRIQENPEILNDKKELDNLFNLEYFSSEEKEDIFEKTKKFHTKSQRKFDFTWKQFWYELLDFERDFFKYLHPNSDKFNVEKDLVDNYQNKEHEEKSKVICPRCNSKNVKFGHAIDYKYDILYVVLSFFAHAPFFPFRKKYHCFDCEHNFKSLQNNL